MNKVQKGRVGKDGGARGSAGAPTCDQVHHVVQDKALEVAKQGVLTGLRVPPPTPLPTSLYCALPVLL